MIENEWGYTIFQDIADDAAFLMRSDLLSTDQHDVVSSVYTRLDELVESYINQGITNFRDIVLGEQQIQVVNGCLNDMISAHQSLHNALKKT
ncbi:hypothetical protein [Vibrio aestuarianus]|uniref:hypothetical protein n=1 Tax=Vibrio aestuarianus TaxID=28171 RepID=UPI0015942E2A|nr:hypothetical protein [Vibrio aestuarianus]MDE1235121.1 hypothetical protein [Vibrio aestuarianus]MDE1245996.1 hypothetical protein [Vibrio aestuarianus]NGZ63215.1 hypothetical protein [Vibrio aestuarianus subsp. cardii]